MTPPARDHQSQAGGRGRPCAPPNLNSSIAAIEAVRQAGVYVKAALLTAGYDTRAAKTAGSVVNDATFAIPFAPFELNLPAQQTYKQALVTGIQEARRLPGQRGAREGLSR